MIQQVERYTIDPERVSLQLFYEQTRSKKLIPSRVNLQDGIERYFEILKTMGIHNLKQLIASLGNKEKIKNLSNKTGIPDGYLTLFKREAGSYLSKPFALSSFPGIPLEYTEMLKSRGIRNTREFFESVQSDAQRKQMAAQTGIPEARLRELFSLCDLSRITGVGGFYARIIYQSGIRTVRDFATTDSATHQRKYMEILAKRGYPVKPLGEEDLQYCIDYARILAELNSNPDRS